MNYFSCTLAFGVAELRQIIKNNGFVSKDVTATARDGASARISVALRRKSRHCCKRRPRGPRFSQSESVCGWRYERTPGPVDPSAEERRRLDHRSVTGFDEMISEGIRRGTEEQLALLLALRARAIEVVRGLACSVRPWNYCPAFRNQDRSVTLRHVEHITHASARQVNAIDALRQPPCQSDAHAGSPLVRQACCFEALYATNAGPKSWCSIPGHKTDKCREHWAFEQSAYQKC